MCIRDSYDTGDGADARRILDVMSDYAEGPDYDAGWPGAPGDPSEYGDN